MFRVSMKFEDLTPISGKTKPDTPDNMAMSKATKTAVKMTTQTITTKCPTRSDKKAFVNLWKPWAEIGRVKHFEMIYCKSPKIKVKLAAEKKNIFPSFPPKICIFWIFFSKFVILLFWCFFISLFWCYHHVWGDGRKIEVCDNRWNSLKKQQTEYATLKKTVFFVWGDQVKNGIFKSIF